MDQAFSLPQIAAIVPCHPRQLRRRMREGVTPPFIRGPNGRYSFPAGDVQAWLERREEMRRLKKKPHLKWFSAAELIEAAVVRH